MKQFNAIASKLRINALLCCSAVALLTACGGNIDAGGEQMLATAAGVSTDAGAPAAASTAAPLAAVEANAEPAPAAGSEAAAAAGTHAASAASTEAAPAASTAATGQAADATNQAFELSGYDSNPLQAQTGPQDAGANAPAPIKQ